MHTDMEEGGPMVIRSSVVCQPLRRPGGASRFSLQDSPRLAKDAGHLGLLGLRP
jgi:hypothetical protein